MYGRPRVNVKVERDSTFACTRDLPYNTSKTLFTWSGGPRFSGVAFFCFVTPRA